MSTPPPTPAPCRVVAGYFNNGVNPNRPWWVGIKQRRAIVATLGNFPCAAAAIVYAKRLGRQNKLPLIVPPWLTWLAAAIELSEPVDDPHGFIRLLCELRSGQHPLNRIDETTLAAMEDEWIGDDFCRHPFLD